MNRPVLWWIGLAAMVLAVWRLMRTYRTQRLSGPRR